MTSMASLDEALANPEGTTVLTLLLDDEVVIPERIAELTQLRALCIRASSPLRLPRSFWSLTELESLDLSAVEGGLTADINQLESLEELSLFNHSSSPDPLPFGLGGLTRLRRLSFFDCELQELPAAVFEIEGLKSLTVSVASLGALPERLGRLRAIDELDFLHANVDALPESTGDLTQLKRLSIRGGSLCVLPQSFVKLEALEILELEHCKFPHFPAAVCQDAHDSAFAHPGFAHCG